MKKSFKLQRVAPFLLITSLLFTGCGKKSDCENPTSHVHLYTKEFANGSTISTYFDDEHLNRANYQWQPDLIYIEKANESFYKAKGSKNLFEGADEENFQYLYKLMASNHDYLMFYYEYEEIEEYTEKDSDGEEHTYTRTIHHDGWHSNPYDSDNTGKTRLYHPRYYAYRILFDEEKQEFYLDKRSQLVDDIRKVLPEYPYTSENCVEEVYETYYFPNRELPYLRPEDFDRFEHPDLSNTTPSYYKTFN